MFRAFVLMLSLLTIVGIGFVSAEPAAEKQAEEVQKDQEITTTTTTTTTKVTTKNIVGTIVEIDEDEHAIILKDEGTGENVTYIFDDATLFHRDDAVIKVNTLKTGEKISMEINPEGNTVVRVDTPVKIKIEEEEEDD